MRADPTPQVLPASGLREGVAAGSEHSHEHGGLLDLAALRVMNRDGGPGVIHEHLLAGAVLLPQHQVELLQPPPIEFAETAVAVALRVVLAALLPDQLQGQVFVGLHLLVDLRPVRLGVFPPKCRNRALRKQRPLHLRIIPIRWQRPPNSGRLRGGQVLMHGALRDRTTAGDLVLAQPQRIQA